MKEGQSDIMMMLEGSMRAINKEGEPHPYIMASRYWFMENYMAFACPLPQKIPSFYNIVTPLTVEAWIFASITVLLVTAGFLVINQVYRLIPGQRIAFEWYMLQNSVPPCNN